MKQAASVVYQKIELIMTTTERTTDPILFSPILGQNKEKENELIL
jgi:hypothetical protein